MLEVKNLSDQVHDLLLRQILEGQRASGSALLTDELARELNVSRTPLREAILRLAAEGFVETQPNRSAVVRSLDAEQIQQIFQIREALETCAAASACQNMTDEALARLRGAALGASRSESSAPEELWRLDRELHLLIARQTGNKVLQREIKRYADLAGLVGTRVGHRAGDVEAAYQQHTHLLDAMERRDVEAARQAMAEHIQTTCAGVLRRHAETATSSQPPVRGDEAMT
jgi:DNA-binding GntR family transcriptional regulator